MPDESDRIYSYLKRIIQTSAIGVAYIADGAIKEYSIDVDKDVCISFLVSRSKPDNIIHYNYIIMVNDDLIAEAVISSQAKHLTADEKRIENLFELCSARIIFQETKMAIQKTIDADRQNTHLN